MLDAQEYLHLALKAGEQGNNKEALEYLHKCLEKDPENATAIFLLAAEHAEIGIFDRAKEGMIKALSIDPNLNMASLQLGLLYSREGNDKEALDIWSKLRRDTKDNSMEKIADGLIKLIEKDLEQGAASLHEGMELNNTNPGLNQMVSSILESLEKSAQKSPDKNDIEEKEDKDSVYLGAYKNNVIK